MNESLCGLCFQHELRGPVCGHCKQAAKPRGASLALPVGTLLSREFVIGETLGDPGGFGIAYLGWERDLRRKVVVKELFPGDLVTRVGLDVRVMRPELMPHFNAQRLLFLDEARKLARLEGVASVVRVIRHFAENDTAYFVMPFIPGRALNDVVKQQGPVDAQRLLGWMWPLLEGLQAVHDADVLHRDIKPQNLLLDERGRLVLIDFGNASTSGPDPSGGAAGNFHALSKHYAAPEQYANDRLRMGPHTDLYGLGALMYFCLTGQRPADAAARLSGQPLTPLSQLARATPPALAGVIESCLELDERQRPCSARALLTLLEPLRPSRSWLDCLPDDKPGGYGRRMRRAGAQIQQGRSLPAQFNLAAGVFQWFWFFAMGLPAVGAAVSLLALGLMAFVLQLGAPLEMMPAAFSAAWLIAIVPCALFADGLLYRRISAVAASLPLDTDVQRQNAARRLLVEGLPKPLGILLGAGVPALALALAALIADEQAQVRAKIASAIDLQTLRAEVVNYQNEHQSGPLPNDEQLGYRHTMTKELSDVRISQGTIMVTLQLAPVTGRSVMWKQAPERSGVWICVNKDLEAVYRPAVCDDAGLSISAP